MSTLEIGAAQGALTLRTGVEGRAAKAGHALTLSLPDWSAVVTVESGEPTAVTLTVPWAGLEVVRGEGLLPLSPIDKGVIKRNALKALKASAHPALVFTSSSVTTSPEGYLVNGEVALAGQRGPLAVPVQVSRTGAEVACFVELPFVQTAFGLSPYTAMLGALKVSDEVTVALSVTFPAP